MSCKGKRGPEGSGAALGSPWCGDLRESYWRQDWDPVPGVVLLKVAMHTWLSDIVALAGKWALLSDANVRGGPVVVAVASVPHLLQCTLGAMARPDRWPDAYRA